MQTYSKLAEKGVKIDTLFSDKYKNNSLTLNFLLPMNDKTIAEAHVLSCVLLRGCKKYRTLTEFERKLNMLYDPMVSVRAYKTTGALVFKIIVSYIDERFLPEGESGKLLSEITELLYELLYNAFPDDKALFEKYTESEKKLRIDTIRAEKNNKDSYAIAKCQQIMFSGSPLGCNGKGTEAAVAAINAESLRVSLDSILRTAPVYIMYAGTERECDIKTLNGFALELFGNREPDKIINPKFELPSYKNVPENVTEQADAAQGREVLAFELGDFRDSLCKADLFNEIFGGSPISRLFMNVREKLHLCYYCASNILNSVSAMFVRSGVANENREKAVNEIKTQLEILKNPENISEFEFYAAKKTLKDYYLSLRDDIFRYSDWKFSRYLDELSCNVDDYIAAIDSYTMSDVSDVARSAVLRLDYFLEGKADA